MSGQNWLRLLIVGACLIGLAGSAFLAVHLRDANTFYSAGSGVVMAIFFSWIFGVWEDEGKLRSPPAGVARRVAEQVMVRLTQDTPLSHGIAALTHGQYKQLEQQLAEVIERGVKS
jgi:hypothetical protein